MWIKYAAVLFAVVTASFAGIPAGAEEAADPLDRYVASFSGDPRGLNPILCADSASSEICGMVFEGLLDRDENLVWRGRLAASWETEEEAYFVPNARDGRTADQMAELIRSAKEKRANEAGPLGRCLRNIRAVAVAPPQKVAHTVQEENRAADDEGEADVTVTVSQPARVRLSLQAVDEDVFATLGELVGKDYFEGFDGSDRVEVSPARFAGKRREYADRFLPAAEHNPVITFHLRRGVKFHDGHEFDSGDVKFTYEATVAPRNLSTRALDFEAVKSVEAVDKYTVRVMYRELYSPGLASWGVGILPEHLLNNERLAAEARLAGTPPERFSIPDSAFNYHPVGCGPFRFDEWRTGSYVRLKSFADYWEGAPEFKEVLVRIIEDRDKAKEAFLAGSLDLWSPGPGDAAAMARDPRFRSFSGLSYGYTYIGYNMRRDLFKDMRVRRALGMAIDADALIKDCLSGQAERITGPFVEQTDYYDRAVKPPPYDPAGARKLLEAAGWKPGRDGRLEKGGRRLEFTLITNSGNPVRKKIAEAVCESWKKIGIDATTDLLEWPVFIDKHVDTGDFDAVVLGWGMDIEPDLYQIWHSSQSNPGQLNFVGFKNKDADDLIVRIRQEYDHGKQVELCHRLHRIIAGEQPYTFLFVGKWTALLNRNIVIARRDGQGRVVRHERVKQAKSGAFLHEFNHWVKLRELPESLR